MSDYTDRRREIAASMNQRMCVLKLPITSSSSAQQSGRSFAGLPAWRRPRPDLSKSAYGLSASLACVRAWLINRMRCPRLQAGHSSNTCPSYDRLCCLAGGYIGRVKTCTSSHDAFQRTSRAAKSAALEIHIMQKIPMVWHRD